MPPCVHGGHANELNGVRTGSRLRGAFSARKLTLSRGLRIARFAGKRARAKPAHSDRWGGGRMFSSAREGALKRPLPRQFACS